MGAAYLHRQLSRLRRVARISRLYGFPRRLAPPPLHPGFWKFESIPAMTIDMSLPLDSRGILAEAMDGAMQTDVGIGCLLTAPSNWEVASRLVPPSTFVAVGSKD